MTPWSVYMEVTTRYEAAQAKKEPLSPTASKENMRLESAIRAIGTHVLVGRPIRSAHRISAQWSIEADDGTDAYRRAFAELRQATKGFAPRVVVLQVNPYDDDRIPNLVGVAEAAALLGVSPQRVRQLTERREFPKPIFHLRMGPVFIERQVTRYGEERRRRPGRPPTAARAAEATGVRDPGEPHDDERDGKAEPSERAADLGS